ncbi:hypothetical protein LZK98_16110 [Sphingomonas cannabina]|uniref:hypothetical protein n=1 Tax=Sphingomonas cannabina TaxID=2899123 RepID=UPI001F26792A|nr:hypothetical protein [Sphingomonas cannabina]UIJ44568.1 hypothetical protein LZK98_16110 [Sphingomonas cannabina]
MLARLRSLSLALAAPLILWGCVLTPGKFVSTLDIRADRSFAFTYVGEVYAVDMGKEFTKGLKDSDTDKTSTDATGDEASAKAIAAQDVKGDDAKDGEDSEAKNRAIAEALSKEAGFRKVQYVGNGKFEIDYAASGKLTYPFLFPFSSDAEVIFPFVMVELRGADRIRVKAPAFGADSSKSSMSDAGKAANKVDGTFTLTTDAEIVSQNNESGATTAGGKKTISWRATPTTKDTPMAVLKVAPLAP